LQVDLNPVFEHLLLSSVALADSAAISAFAIFFSIALKEIAAFALIVVAWVGQHEWLSCRAGAGFILFGCKQFANPALIVQRNKSIGERPNRILRAFHFAFHVCQLRIRTTVR